MKRESALHHDGRRAREMRPGKPSLASWPVIVKALVLSIPQASAWPWPAVLAVIADVAREVNA